MPKPRLEFLDGVRALAALFVVAHHAWLTVYPLNQADDLMSKGLSWLRFGAFGVAVFIVVSGFSLTIGPSRRGELGQSYWSFIARRFRRIMLPYYAALLVSLILAVTVLSVPTGTHWDVAIPVGWQSIVVHVLNLQDFAYSGNINHVFWSVALEWHIYFLFPPLLWLALKGRSIPVVAALIVVTTAIADVVFRLQLDIPALAWLNYLGLFAAGSLACQIVSAGGVVRLGRRVFTPRRWWPSVIVGVVLNVGVLGGTDDWTVTSTLLGLTTALAFIAMARGELGVVRSLFQTRFLLWSGTRSYSLYLTHALVLQLVWQYGLALLGFRLDGSIGLVLELVTGLVLSVAVSAVFFRLVEQRFLPTAHRQRIAEETAPESREPALVR